MAWYGSHVDSTKKLDQLIDQSPSLEQLLNYPQFIQQLKAYNPKLLQFLTNSKTIVADLISYIAIPPKQNDSDDRKYKLPVMSIQMIQSQAISVINSFFKDDPKRKNKYFNTLFEQQFSNANKVQGQVLPILAGYFLRVNICLLNNKYRDTIDCMYESQRNFDLLLENSHSLSITNALQVYLNLDSTKNPQTPARALTIKINTIKKMIKLINDSIDSETKGSNRNQSEAYFETLRVQNLSSVMIELLEKYYLIADGKQMVDQILYQQSNVQVFFKGLLNKNSDISLSLINILISIIKFYSLSSFNNEEWNNPEQRKKNEQTLQSQPAIILFINILPDIIDELKSCKSLRIYQAKLMQLVSSSLGLNSHKIFNCVKNCKYFQILFDLMFKFQSCNIFAMMVEKLFLLIFRTQRMINEEIKHHIFCEAKIIDITAGRYLSQFQNDEQIAASMGCAYRRKSYFGHLMKIMKIYSGIQTTDQDIVNSIRSKSETWNKISRIILKPYEAIANKELSTYENIPEMIPNQFSVKTFNNLNQNFSIVNGADNKLIDEINREQAIQNIKTLQNSHQQNKLQAEIITASHKESLLQHKDSSDAFFEAPTAVSKEKFPAPTLQTKQSEGSKSESQSQTVERERGLGSPVLQKKSNSYSDFLEQQKVKAETEIRKERSRSKERALSKGKTRITSPSPTKRVNKWAQNQQKDEKPQAKEKVSLTSGPKVSHEVPKNLPKIPMHKKGLNISSNNNENKDDTMNKSMQLQKKESVQNEITQNKSLPNLDILRQVKILYRIEAPVKKQYRKMTEQDKAIFDSLGIAYS